MLDSSARRQLSDECSNTSNEDCDDMLINSDSESLLNRRNSFNRHQIHRSVRRLTRCVAISLGFLIFLIVIYIPIYNSVQTRMVALPGWGYNTSRNTIDYVFPGQISTIIEPKNICTKDLFLLIVVCSAFDNFVERQNIRETWGNTTDFNYALFPQLHSQFNGTYLDINNLEMYRKYVDTSVNATNISSQKYNLPIRVIFLIGRSERENQLSNETLERFKVEAEHNDDIIQENFLDTYNNLTIKSVMMLKWVTNRCLNRVKFIMKCDDDTFINIPNLMHYLFGGTIPVYNSTIEYHDTKSIKVLDQSNRFSLKDNLLMGYLFCFSKPITNVNSKWYAPMYMFPGEIYPNYLSGSSYIMSQDVVPKLYNAALNATLLHIEDVYITGICAQKINLRRRHNPLFCFEQSTTMCSFKGTIVQHYLRGEKMREIYNFVTNFSIKCPPPAKYFKTKRLRKRLANCS